MRKNFQIILLTVLLSGCSNQPVPKPDSKPQPVVGSVPKPAKPIGITGYWSGYSYGESISVRFGSNGSAILTNSAGANAGSWSSQGSGSYSVNIAGQHGRMVLVSPSTASLTIGGSTIQLNR